MKNNLLSSYYLGLMFLFLGMSSFFMGIYFYFMSKVLFVEWELGTLSSCSVIMTLIFDWMSLSFSGLVMLISSMVLFYSSSYMTGDKNFYRFIILVYLFVISMIFLIISPNMISILIGWDGLGLVSYCLVIYYQNVKSANAGMLTVLTNRVGDVAILLSISWMLNFGSWNFYYLNYMISSNEMLFILMMVVLAGMTKSAQIPFSAWLPAAMAAPTPVSSLVHSSTLVTAGVYLLIRFNFLLGESKFLFLISVLTMFMSGYGANFEMDLKKIIALSTLSQLGVMMMTLSLGFYELSFFHLMAHALFKSLLFLCAGAIIHGMGDIQDIRYLGGVLMGLPVISVFFISSSLALCGFPFLAGFYSKDLILEMFFSGHMNGFMLLMVFMSTMFTLTYSIRLIYFIFFKNLGLKSFLSLEEAYYMYKPMMFLFIMSVTSGALMSWVIFPPFLVLLPLGVKCFVMLGLASFTVLSFLMFKYMKMSLSATSTKSSSYFGSMWFMPYLSTIFIIPLIYVGKYFMKNFDQAWLEKLSGQGAYLSLSAKGTQSDYMGSLNLKSYLFLFLFILMILFFML